MRPIGWRFRYARDLEEVIALQKQTVQSFAARVADFGPRRYSEGFLAGLTYARDLHAGKIRVARGPEHLRE